MPELTPDGFESDPGMIAGSSPGTARAIALAVAGWLVGYLISAVSSVLFFVVGHIRSHQPASAAVMIATAVFGIVFAVIGAVVGSSLQRRFALGIGAAIALTIGAMAMWSWYETPADAHWSQAIAILLMAPAAQFGAFFRREDF